MRDLTFLNLVTQKENFFAAAAAPGMFVHPTDL